MNKENEYNKALSEDLSKVIGNALLKIGEKIDNDLYSAFKGKNVLVGSVGDVKYQGTCIAAGREGVLLKNNDRIYFVSWQYMSDYHVTLTEIDASYVAQ